MTASDWQLALTKHGAVIQDGTIQHYADAKAEIAAVTQANTLCDLTHLGLLEIGGADAVNFLQGQVTNDVKLLTGNNAHFTGYCTPKGRLLALFLAFSHYDHVHLQLNRDLLQPIMKRLKMYVMRSKVDIKDVSETIIKFGINGPNAAKQRIQRLPIFLWQLMLCKLKQVHCAVASVLQNTTNYCALKKSWATRRVMRVCLLSINCLNKLS